MKKISKINLINNIIIGCSLFFNLAGYWGGEKEAWINIVLLVALLGVSIYSTIAKVWGGVAIVLLLSGWISTFFGGPGNATGIIFIIFGIHVVKRSAEKVYVIIVVTVLALVAKGAFFNQTFNQILNISFFYVAVFLVYWVLLQGGESGK